MPDERPIVNQCPRREETDSFNDEGLCATCRIDPCPFGHEPPPPIVNPKVGDKVRYVRNTHTYDVIPKQYRPTIGIEGKVSYVHPGEKWVYVEFDEPANQEGDTILVFYYDELEKI